MYFPRMSWLIKKYVSFTTVSNFADTSIKHILIKIKRITLDS